MCKTARNFDSDETVTNSKLLLAKTKVNFLGANKSRRITYNAGADRRVNSDNLRGDSPQQPVFLSWLVCRNTAKASPLHLRSASPIY
jgi:hypothetical protein